jgi:hypothetical protein
VEGSALMDRTYQRLEMGSFFTGTAHSSMRISISIVCTFGQGQWEADEISLRAWGSGRGWGIRMGMGDPDGDGRSRR